MAEKKPPQPAEQQPSERTTPTRAGRRPRRRRRLLTAMLVLLVGLAFLPTLILYTPARHWIVNRLLASSGLTCQLGTVRGGWWTPLAIRGLTIHSTMTDPPSQLLAVEEITTDRTLLRLITGPFHLGTIRVTRLQADFERTAQGTNWEPLVARMSGPSNGQSGQAVTFELLELVDGTVNVVDRVSGEQVTVDQLHGQAGPSDGKSLPSASWNARFLTAGQTGTWQTKVESAAGGRPVLSTHLAGLPLKIIPPLLCIPPEMLTELEGQLNIDGTIELGTAEHNALIADLRADVAQLAVTSPQWLGTDRPTWDQASCTVRLQSDDNGLTISGWKLDSPWIHTEGSGFVPGPQSTQAWEMHLQGDANLALIGNNLPHTLRVREGLQWQSGLFRFQSQLQHTTDGWFAQVTGRATDIAAVEAQKSYRWNSPAELDVRVRSDDAGNWQLEKLQVDAAFAKLEGQGTLAAGQLLAECDLGLLDQELDPFFELPWERLAGKARWDGQWQTKWPQIVWSSRGETTGVSMVRSADQTWSEPEGKWHAEGELHGPASASDAWELAHFQGDLRLGADAVEIKSLRGAHWKAGTWELPVQVNLNGQLATWRARLRGWLEADLPDMQGDLHCDSRWIATQQGITAEHIEAHIRPVQVQYAGWTVREPRAVLKTSFVYDLQQKRWTSPQTSLLSTSLSIVGNELSLQSSPGPFHPPLGQIALHGQLDRINQTLNNRLSDLGIPTRGKVVGQLQSRASHDGAELTGQLTIENLQLGGRTIHTVSKGGSHQVQGALAPGAAGIPGGPKGQAHHDNIVPLGNVVMSLQGRWLQSSQVPVLDQWSLHSPLLQMTAKSQLVGQGNQRIVETNGQAVFDWQTVMACLPASARPWIDLQGTPTSPVNVRIQAPETPAPQTPAPETSATAAVDWTRRVEAQLSTNWDRGELFDLPMGPGKMQLRWLQQQLDVAPLEVTLGTGTAHLAARLGTQHPYWLEVPAGPLVQNIDLHREVCHKWLKYVAAFGADASAAEGRISVQLDQLRMPLADIPSGTMQGTVHVHHARLGPGPLSKQVLHLAHQIKSLVRGGGAVGEILNEEDNWVVMPDQKIDFAMQGGQVLHRGVRFIVADGLELSTSGQVGLDNSLALQIEIPLTPAWLRDERASRLLAGQKLVIPVGGTVQQPRLDVRSLGQIWTNSARQAAENVLKGEVDKQLQKLIPDVPLLRGLPTK